MPATTVFIPQLNGHKSGYEHQIYSAENDIQFCYGEMFTEVNNCHLEACSTQILISNKFVHIILRAFHSNRSGAVEPVSVSTRWPGIRFLCTFLFTESVILPAIYKYTFMYYCDDYYFGSTGLVGVPMKRISRYAPSLSWISF